MVSVMMKLNTLRWSVVQVINLCLSICFFKNLSVSGSPYFSGSHHRHSSILIDSHVQFCAALKLGVIWIMDELTNWWTDLIHGRYFKETEWEQCSHTYDSLHLKHCDNCFGHNKAAIPDHLNHFSIYRVFLPKEGKRSQSSALNMCEEALKWQYKIKPQHH